SSEASTLLPQTSGSDSFAFPVNGKRFYAGTWGGPIKVWDMETRQEILPLLGHKKPVRKLQLSADGKRLCSGCDNQVIKVWDLEAGKELLTFHQLTPITSLAFSRDGKRLYSGGAGTNSPIQVWDLETGKAVLTLLGHTRFVSCLVLSADGKRL